MARKIFKEVAMTKPKANIFNLSHDKKLSTKFGKLVPIMVMDCVPGDRVQLKSNVLVRFAPMLAPVMHRVNVYVHYFFVPTRIQWDNFEKFITGGENGLDNTVWPHFNANMANIQPSSLHDYLGTPTAVDGVSEGSTTQDISMIPYNAYQRIYDEYYRDQNLIASDYAKLTDGANPTGPNTTLRKRSWQHDYFTSALPWTQRGAEAMIPLGGNAPIEFDDNSNLVQTWRRVLDQQPFTPENAEFSSTSLQANGGAGQGAGYVNLEDTHYADLSEATATSIIDLRRAFRLQEWLEKNARGGARYTESILVHFGVHSSDKRLQRPEYLGGSMTPVKISEVLQTTQDLDVGQDTPLGTMGGHGISVGGTKKVAHFCEEHGYVMGIMSVMPVATYQQGIPRHMLRADKFDYFWPEFQHIGEQPIYVKELAGRSVDGDEVFGYAPRYSEYKYIPNTVHGDFKDTLAFWHMGRKFADTPALNQDFVEMDDEEVNRVFAVYDPDTGEVPYDTLWCHILNEVVARRPMAVYGNPKI